MNNGVRLWSVFDQSGDRLYCIVAEPGRPIVLMKERSGEVMEMTKTNLSIFIASLFLLGFDPFRSGGVLDVCDGQTVMDHLKEAGRDDLELRVLVELL